MKNGFLRTFLLNGVMFGIPMGIFFALQYDAITGILAGAAAGLLFGLAMAAIAEAQWKKFRKIGLEVTKGKPIVLSGPANLMSGAQVTGGWFYMTEDELIFKPQKYNVLDRDAAMPFPEMKEALPEPGFARNRMIIVRKDGGEMRFVVIGRDTWVAEIGKRIAAGG